MREVVIVEAVRTPVGPHGGALARVLQRAGLEIDDIDLIELNEAFAVQALACIKGLGLDQARTNVNGGGLWPWGTRWAARVLG